MSEVLGLTATPATQSIEYKIRAAEQLVRQELEQTQGDVCVTNSFQAEDMIVLHLVRHVLPDVPVIFLDTGYHFAEVYEYRDRMVRAWSMNLINLLPELTVPEQEAQFGILNQTDPGRCCSLRKDHSQDQPTYRVDREGRLGLCPTARHSTSPSLRPGLLQHRLRALHQPTR
jgi:3'-phosphoadenosine 5'-phosphosulfate sulfotransferase (PAPS reductase)/FAD synthetase